MANHFGWLQQEICTNIKKGQFVHQQHAVVPSYVHFYLSGTRKDASLNLKSKRTKALNLDLPWCDGMFAPGMKSMGEG